MLGGKVCRLGDGSHKNGCDGQECRGDPPGNAVITNQNPSPNKAMGKKDPITLTIDQPCFG